MTRPEEHDARESPDENPQFSLSLSTDSGRFLRRTCPSCGRDFKTDFDEADIAWGMAPAIERIGREFGAAVRVDDNDEPLNLVCPYCEHSAEANEMLTDETVDYLHRHIYREVVLPMTKDLFSGLDGVGSGSGGFLSFKVEVSNSIDPPRPIHGPEPPDMKIVEFICCDRSAKISDRWYALSKCVYCGSPVVLS